MARGRMLNKKVAMSKKVAAYGDEFGPWAVVFHHRLIAFLDVNGCCRADPFWLKAEVMARVSGILPEDCRKFSVGLVQHKLAILYEVDGMPYLHMPGFRDEQVGLRPDKEAPEFPAPREGMPLPVQFPDGGRNGDGMETDNGRGEVEVEVEEKPTDTIVSGAVPRVEKSRRAGSSRPAGSKQGIAARFMPIIRESLYLDGIPPKDWSESRDVSICERLLTSTTPDDLEAAIRGLDRLRGSLDWLGPKDKATMRCLHDTRTGVRPVFRVAQEAYWRADSRRQAASPSKDRLGRIEINVRRPP